MTGAAGTGLTRRGVLVALGTVGALGALGGGATAAFLRDDEDLPRTVVESGDVRFVDCELGGTPAFDEVSLSLTDPAFADTSVVAEFGVASVPAWLVARVCPPDGLVGDYLDGSVQLVVDHAGGDSVTPDPFALGDRLVAAIYPGENGACGDVVTLSVTASLDEAAVQEDGVEGSLSGDTVDLTLEALLVQQTGVTAGDARNQFAALFGDCGGSNDAPPGGDGGPIPPGQGSGGPPGKGETGGN